MVIKNIGVVANTKKNNALRVLGLLSARASELGISLFADRATAALVECCNAVDIDEMGSCVEAVIALGGDGTVLRTVRKLGFANIPVIGINIGGLGFLTSVSEDKLDIALKCLSDGEYTVSNRSVIRCDVLRGRDIVAEYRALNDVVIATGSSLRILTLDVKVDNKRLSSYVCDGLIVSTPTGSTGHALSAGGPIVAPEMRAFVIALICPHTLSSRPLLVPDTSSIQALVADATENIPLSVDGQTWYSLQKGDRIVVRLADETVRFVHLPDYSYFGVLRQKLHWSGSNL